MSTNLITTRPDGTMTTTCSSCQCEISLTVQASIFVRNSGKRPMCGDCRNKVPAARAASYAAG